MIAERLNGTLYYGRYSEGCYYIFTMVCYYIFTMVCPLPDKGQVTEKYKIRSAPLPTGAARFFVDSLASARYALRFERRGARIRAH